MQNAEALYKRAGKQRRAVEKVKPLLEAALAEARTFPHPRPLCLWKFPTGTARHLACNCKVRDLRLMPCVPGVDRRCAPPMQYPDSEAGAEL